MAQPCVQVNFQRITAGATIEVGDRAVPTLINSVTGTITNAMVKLKLAKTSKQKFMVLKDISGMLQPVCFSSYTLYCAQSQLGVHCLKL